MNFQTLHCVMMSLAKNEFKCEIKPFSLNGNFALWHANLQRYQTGSHSQIRIKAFSAQKWFTALTSDLVTSIGSAKNVFATNHPSLLEDVELFSPWATRKMMSRPFDSMAAKLASPLPLSACTSPPASSNHWRQSPSRSLHTGASGGQGRGGCRLKAGGGVLGARRPSYIGLHPLHSQSYKPAIGLCLVSAVRQTSATKPYFSTIVLSPPWSPFSLISTLVHSQQRTDDNDVCRWWWRWLCSKGWCCLSVSEARALSPRLSTQCRQERSCKQEQNKQTNKQTTDTLPWLNESTCEQQPNEQFMTQLFDIRAWKYKSKNSTYCTYCQR